MSLKFYYGVDKKLFLCYHSYIKNNSFYMLEGGFKPEGSDIEKELEKFRRGLIQEIEKINDTGRIISIMQEMGITITEPITELKTAQEALQSFIRGYSKSELERMQAVMREIEEEDEEL
ncbi:MAG: hypothetical protein AAB487_00410 [Patescibacteria group bacterium]